jgi:CheY-like chemotaxis protein
VSQADPQATSAAQRSATILIVEDDPTVLTLVRDVLTMEGHCVDVARTGQKAWERLAEGDYDVVLCDLALPGLDGPRLHRRLAEARPDLVGRLIFLSGYGCGEAETLLGAASVPILRAPFRVDDLLKMVEDVRRPA